MAQNVSYDAALQEYKNKNYEKTISVAEQILSLSAIESEIIAYTLQLLTASCIETNNHQKGLQYIDREVALFQKESSRVSYIEALKKKAGFLLLAGNPLDAARIYHETGLHFAKTRGEASYDFFKASANEAEALLEAGKLQEAGKLFEMALEGFRKDPGAGEDYLYALYYTGYLLNIDKKFREASDRLNEFISIAEASSLRDLPEYEEARKIISSINISETQSQGSFLVPEDKAKQYLAAAVKLQEASPEEALKPYQECQALIEKNNMLSNTSFSCYLNYARALYSLNRVTEASEMVRRADEQAQRLFAGQGAEFGLVQVIQADIAMKTGRKAEALSFYSLAINNLQTGPGEKFARQAVWITGQLAANNALNEASACAATAIQHPAFSGFPAKDKIHLYTLYGYVLSNSRKADVLTNELRQKLSTEKDPALRQCFYLLLAKISADDNKLNDARDFLRSAAAASATGLLIPEIYYESARVYQRLGNFREAETNFRKASDLAPRSFEAASLAPQVYNSFANFYMDLGNYAAAEKLYLELLSEKTDPAFQTTVRQNLAAIYEQTGRMKEAKKLLMETIRSDRERLGEQHPDLAVSLQNMAVLYQRTGSPDSAKLLFEKALAIDKMASGEQSVVYAASLANLAAVYQDLDEFDKARLMLETSLAIRKKLLAPQHPDYAFNLYSLGYLLSRTGRPMEALPYFRESSSLYIRQIKDVFMVQSDYERTAFYNKVQPVINGFQVFALENHGLHETLAGELLNFRLETKALLLNSSIKVRNQILASGKPELISNFTAWQHTKEQLAHLYTLAPEERMLQADLIASYSKKANDLEKLLTEQSNSFATSFDPQLPDWTRIQAALKPGEAAVEIVRVARPGPDSILYAVLIVKQGIKQPEVVVLPDGGSLETRSFKRYINSIRFFHVDKYPYEIFWKDIDAKLKGVKTVYFSPDGVFNKINCLTFFDSEKGEYVVDRLQIHLLSNLKDLLDQTASASSPKQASLIGFPDYRLPMQSRPSPGNLTRSPNAFSVIAINGIADLPGTDEEVTRIKDVLTRNQWQVSFNTRQNASEETVKALKDPGVLHIATHGFFIASPTDQVAEISGSDLAYAENNVMLRSGLLLAGAETNLIQKLTGASNGQAEDGVLTAFEVMNLNLDKTDMVILSACETGRGNVRNGEGVYGLQRAFMLAGARNLLMSLWKVDDHATQELMTDFYPRWLRGEGRHTAFYNTMLEMKKKYEFPFYWGAFVMVGKP